MSLENKHISAFNLSLTSGLGSSKSPFLYQLAIPIHNVWEYLLPHVVILLNFHHSDRWEMASWCCFDLHFSHYEWARTFFLWLRAIFRWDFGKLSVHVFPFFCKVFSHLILKLTVLYILSILDLCGRVQIFSQYFVSCLLTLFMVFYSTIAFSFIQSYLSVFHVFTFASGLWVMVRKRFATTRFKG